MGTLKTGALSSPGINPTHTYTSIPIVLYVLVHLYMYLHVRMCVLYAPPSCLVVANSQAPYMDVCLNQTIKVLPGTGIVG